MIEVIIYPLMIYWIILMTTTLNVSSIYLIKKTTHSLFNAL